MERRASREVRGFLNEKGGENSRVTHVQLNIQSAHVSASSAKGQDWFSLSPGDGAGASGALFSGMLSAMQGNGGANAVPGTDPAAQIAALVQSGVPPSKISDTIAQKLIDALQQQTGKTLSQEQVDRIRASIGRLVAQFGSPNHSPPVTRKGQKNEVSGNILDAASAKEIPARAPDKETSSTLDVSSLVQSSIAQALASLQQSPVVPAAPSRVSFKDDLAKPTHGPAQAPASPIAALPLAPAPVPSPDPSQATAAGADDRTGEQSQGQAPANAPPVIAMANAPDLLARMLVRAAGTDARTNGNAMVTAPQTPGTPQSPQALAARFEAALTTIVQNAVGHASPGSSNGQGGNLLDQQLSSQPNISTHDVSSAPSSIAAQVPSFLNALQTVAHQTPVQPSTVDANALIEQMMKSLSVHTNDQGSSTIRLHLQPENLGDMTMHITVSGSQISANVVASSADVRNTLLSSHQQLARSLADAGLTLSGFSVDVSGGNAGRDHHRDRTSGFGRRFVVHELHAPASDTPALSTLAPAEMGGTNLELFNYLV